MNMKKFMAGFAAATLAVTSLATVASADDDFATFAKFNVADTSSYDYYDVRVDTGGTIQQVPVGKKVSVNIVNSVENGLVKHDYFYVKRNMISFGVRVEYICLSFYFNGQEFLIPGTPDYVHNVTTWTGVTLAEGDIANVKSLQRYYSTNQYGYATDNLGKVPTNVALQDVQIVYKETIWASPTDANGDLFIPKPDNYPAVTVVPCGRSNQFELEDINFTNDIATRDIVNYEGGNEQQNQNLFLSLEEGTEKDENGKVIDNVVFKQNSTQEEKTGDISLSVARTKYTVTPYVRIDNGGIDRLWFYTEDVTLSSNPAGLSEVNAYRLNKNQQEDARNLNKDSKMRVTIKFNGITNQATTIYVQTDLMLWRRDAAQPVSVGANQTSVTFDMPIKAFFDDDYRVGYSSGFVGFLNYWVADANHFRKLADNYNVAPERMSEALFEYNKADLAGADVEGPAADGANDTVYTNTWGTADGGKTTLIYTQDALYGNGGVNLDVTQSKLRADGKGYDYVYVLLDKNGNKTNIKSPITVRVYAPEGRKIPAGLTTIDHTLNDGTVEKLAIVNVATYQAQGYVEVKMPSFSSLNLPLEAEDTTPAEDVTPEVTTTTEAPAETTTTAAPAADNKGGNPPTGVVLVAIPAVLAAAGVIISKKRK